MLPVVTAAEMRALDRATIDEVGIPGFTLMETAGRGVAETAVAMLLTSGTGSEVPVLGTKHHASIASAEAPAAAAGYAGLAIGGAGLGFAGLANAMVAGRSVAVVCGPGNNGGDGFVIARVLRSRGVNAVAYLAIDRAAVKGDALLHLEVLERSSGVILSIATRQELEHHRDAIARAELVVDALFGTGLQRPVEGHFAQVIEAINRAPLRLAVDIPSGLDTDTGRALGVAVDANATSTMAALKVALVSSPGFARCGEVSVVDIGVPPGLLAASTPHAGLIERADIVHALPARSSLDHKGRRGHVLVVGGKPEMRGAGRLASFAALRAGAGLVTMTIDEPLAPAAALGDPADSVMTKVVRDPLQLAVAIGDVTRREKATDAAGSTSVGSNLAAAVVIGPGLGTSADARACLAAVLDSGVPAVLDADALNLLAGAAATIAAAAGPIVITPHPAEAARLLSITTAEVEADRLHAARRLAAATRAVVVLKGARTIICDGTIGDAHCAINPTGGPALATAGSGDVLAGTIAAFLAQGCSAADAARIGAYVHGLAGEELARSYGERGVISSDLPVAIALVLASL